MNIILVDDHKIVRDGLKALLLAKPEHRVAGEAADSARLSDLLRHRAADLVVLDLKLPGDMDGLQMLQSLRQEHPSVKVLMISGEWSYASVQSALRLGVHGLMAKESGAYLFLEALEAIEAGRSFVDPALAAFAFAAPSAPLQRLSEREQEVLAGFARGLSYKEIAAQLCISPRTVETHKQSILRKLNLQNTYDLIRFAMAQGLV